MMPAAPSSPKMCVDIATNVQITSVHNGIHCDNSMLGVTISTYKKYYVN